MPGSNTFPRQERLTRKSDFDTVYKHGQKQVGREFVCYVARREGQGRKVGLSVSRRVGKAVVRNRIKRFIREAYRTSRSEMAPDVYMVVIARPRAAQLTYAQSAHAIRELLSRGKVLRG